MGVYYTPQSVIDYVTGSGAFLLEAYKMLKLEELTNVLDAPKPDPLPTAPQIPLTLAACGKCGRPLRILCERDGSYTPFCPECHIAYPSMVKNATPPNA